MNTSVLRRGVAAMGGAPTGARCARDRDRHRLRRRRRADSEGPREARPARGDGARPRSRDHRSLPPAQSEELRTVRWIDQATDYLRRSEPDRVLGAIRSTLEWPGSTQAEDRQIRRNGGMDGGWSESTSANPRTRHSAKSSVSVTAAGSMLAAIQHVSRCVFRVIIDAQPGKGPNP